MMRSPIRLMRNLSSGGSVTQSANRPPSCTAFIAARHCAAEPYRPIRCSALIWASKMRPDRQVALAGQAQHRRQLVGHRAAADVRLNRQRRRQRTNRRRLSISSRGKAASRSSDLPGFASRGSVRPGRMSAMPSLVRRQGFGRREPMQQACAPGDLGRKVDEPHAPPPQPGTGGFHFRPGGAETAPRQQSASTEARKFRPRRAPDRRGAPSRRGVRAAAGCSRLKRVARRLNLIVGEFVLPHHAAADRIRHAALRARPMMRPDTVTSIAGSCRIRASITPQRLDEGAIFARTRSPERRQPVRTPRPGPPGWRPKPPYGAAADHAVRGRGSRRDRPAGRSDWHFPRVIVMQVGRDHRGFHRYR